MKSRAYAYNTAAIADTLLVGSFMLHLIRRRPVVMSPSERRVTRLPTSRGYNTFKRHPVPSLYRPLSLHCTENEAKTQGALKIEAYIDVIAYSTFVPLTCRFSRSYLSVPTYFYD